MKKEIDQAEAKSKVINDATIGSIVGTKGRASSRSVVRLFASGEKSKHQKSVVFNLLLRGIDGSCLRFFWNSSFSFSSTPQETTAAFGVSGYPEGWP